MHFILAAILVAVVLINKHLTKKKQEEQRKPTLEKWSIDSLKYVLTWNIFQDLVDEVYLYWNQTGDGTPIGIYHHKFREIGKRFYQGRTPAEEALYQAVQILRQQGYDIYLPCELDQEGCYNTNNQIRIYATDFSYERPDRIYYQYLHCLPKETGIMYKQRFLVEPQEDDWRRREYADSNGGRHKLRYNYRSYEEHPRIGLQHDWSVW